MQFTYGNLYYYTYSPVTQNLPIFDRQPLVIFINIMGVTALGVNMHWIPAPLRIPFMQVILEMQSKAYSPQMFRLWYNTIKFNPNLHFCLGAIRKYYLSHCYNIQIIPPEEWPNMTQVWGQKYRARYMRRSISNPLIHI